MKSLLTSVFFLLLFFQLPAQKQKIQEKEWFIRFNPFGLADPFETNLSAGTEYIFNDRLAATADIAWVINGRLFSNARQSGGLLVRPGFRYYFNELHKGFIEIEGHYKQTGYTIHDWLGKDCVNDVPAYEALQDFRYVKKVWGLQVKGGFRGSLTKDQKLWLEGYWGIGFHIRNTSIKDEPRSCYNPQGDLFNPAFDGMARPTLPIGLRILFKL